MTYASLNKVMKIGLVSYSLSILVACDTSSPDHARLDSDNNNSVITHNRKQLKSSTNTKQTKLLLPKSDIQASCLQLQHAMQEINSSSQISAIHNIQQSLDNCLPYADNDTVTSLLRSYQDMYARFLHRGEEMSDDYEQLLYTIDSGQTATKDQWQAVNARSRYLLQLLENGEDIQIKNLGEGYFALTHDLTSMFNLFKPYLTEDQAVFLQRMAQDNQEVFWMDASVTITLAELIERAVFWENYLNNYPNGYAHQDAKLLFDFYQQVLFYGSENTQWTDDTLHYFMQPEDRMAMQQLAKRQHSILAKNAKKLLAFMALSDKERFKKYPVDINIENGNLIQAISVARYQFDQAMQLPTVEERHHRNCLDGLFCHDDPDFTTLEVSPTFANACPSAHIGNMLLDKDFSVWGYDFDARTIDQYCYEMNLKDLRALECSFSLDWKQNPSISLFKNQGGVTKIVYESKEFCNLALATN